VLVEQVVEYNDFEVQRIRLTPAACYSCKKNKNYAVLMVIAGSIILYGDDEHKLNKNQPFAKSNHYLSGQAILLPASQADHQWLAGDEGAILLVALPLGAGNR
jgi:mannose-6-phosphate isomerase class I